MTRHPTARRVHRKETAPDDAFVAGVLETTAWAQQHRRTLIIGGVVALVVILGVFFFVTSRTAQRERAAEQLTQVRATVLSGNNQLAIRDLEQYLANFGGTPSAEEARLLLGRAHLQEGQTQQAIQAVRDLSRNPNTVTGANAAFLEAAAYEAAGDAAQAEAAYLRIADRARFRYLQQDALDNAARVRLERGDAAGAVQLYDRILGLTPETDPSRQVFELRAGEARAAAAAGGAPAAAGN